MKQLCCQSSLSFSPWAPAPLGAQQRPRARHRDGGLGAVGHRPARGQDHEDAVDQREDEFDNAGKPASISDVKVGDRVVIDVPKNSSEAHEVQIGTAPKAAAK